MKINYYPKNCLAHLKLGFAIALLLNFFSIGNTNAQVTVTGNQTATILAQTLVGAGVNISNATLNCPSNANGLFTVVTSNLGLDSGIVLTSGQAQTILTPVTTAGVNGSQTGFFPSINNNFPGDPDLTALASNSTFDACKLEFDFVPAGDTIKFDYVFGSEEYDGFSCSSFNDVFGFIISGPGFVVPKNIALIPGTTFPVSINSTTNPAVTLPGSTTACTNIGAGSPFAQYYVDNSIGTSITYYGFTTVLTAITAVQPCTTYHLKLAIADAGDGILDSGVFLKAGSLTSNAITIAPLGGGGLSAPVPYCVRGCLPGRFVFSRPVPSPNPLTIKYLIQGDAVNGLDYSMIADSVVIPGGQLTDTLLINPLIVPGNIDDDTVRLLVLSPYNCASGMPQILDTAELVIKDSFYVKILTPDTSICKYQSVHILTEGDSLLTYNWTPQMWLDSPNTLHPTATPLQTITYTVAATLSGSGCPASTDQITIAIQVEPAVDAGPDRAICLGDSVQFNLNISPIGPNYHVQWTPPTYLNYDTIPNPISTPLADVTYFIEVDPGAVGCFGYDTVSIRVLPNDFQLFNHDTAICKGASVQINALGDTAFNYTWSPVIYVSDPNIIDPIITPDTTTSYTLTATFPGCTDIVKNLKIDVQPNPMVFAGADREKCQFDTLHIQGIVTPAYYPNYSYSWTPAGGINNPTLPDIIFSGQTNVLPLTLTVTTPAGCTGSDNLNITVHPGNFGTLNPIDPDLCPRDTVFFTAGGGVSYVWSPGFFLSDSTINNPLAYPVANTLYAVIITDQFSCTDTLESYVTVHPDAVLNYGPDVTIYPGESAQLQPSGNCLYYSWFPPLGLSSTTISNPVATPVVDTRYFVQGTTEYGCTATDSIDVIVSAESVLDLPNAFSPGSAPNGEIKIVKRGIVTLKSFSIFNRWGAKVFETTDIEKGWNGRFNGEPQPMGVYIYTIEAQTSAGRPFIKQGNITLIR